MTEAHFRTEKVIDAAGGAEVGSSNDNRRNLFISLYSFSGTYDGYSSMREGWSPPPVNLAIISSHGGLGDQIARLPAYKYMIEHFRHISATIYVQDYFMDLAEYLLPQEPRLAYKKLSEAPYAMPKPYVEFDPDRITSLSLHLTDQAFLMLTDSLPPSREARCYPLAPLTPEGEALVRDLKSWREALAEDFVVITAGYTSRTRQWPSVHVNALARRLRAQGLTPVLLGDTRPMKTGTPNDDIQADIGDGLDRSLFVDLTNKTTLIEALGIMQRAKAVVGVDNGLLHLAHCTDVPIVYGFTSLLPQHRVPYRKQYLYSAENTSTWRAEHGATEVLEALVPCRGCQSRGTFINNDWRTCLFGDYACTLTLTADRFMTSLKKLGVLDQRSNTAVGSLSQGVTK